MSGLNGDFAVLIQELDTVELMRLEEALLFADRSGLDPANIDLKEVLGELRESPRPAPLRLFPANEHDRNELDGGRAYEISIERPKLTPDEAAAQYEREWDEVNRLVAAGRAFDAAWATIRGEARTTLFDLSLEGGRVRRHSRRARLAQPDDDG